MKERQRVKSACGWICDERGACSVSRLFLSVECMCRDLIIHTVRSRIEETGQNQRGASAKQLRYVEKWGLRGSESKKKMGPRVLSSPAASARVLTLTSSSFPSDLASTKNQIKSNKNKSGIARWVWLSTLRSRGRFYKQKEEEMKKKDTFTYFSNGTFYCRRLFITRHWILYANLLY